ncbi:hypothetical protein [Flavobacterium psychrophilum]|uniref:Uncharacterized protein n=1 Tax=Flavobacterium psychrophilum (strain ATCC 49511 / DSM 21280 / CIP 103535 / JIP02/86) TaxID=402612 RepID=A6GX99_FLAPJ|nr:hypothetical protein [Flavobacterium psychrophilum]AIJ38207.1 Putative membrane spanning protein [Flavobacterium psychrophilum]EKT3974786.1 hypothetical protein [Flavobacterium psychrophilum]EKT4526843.1 hypothetical protein [Flavobacterium psychrophilum]EKT4534719.1 hypothetical protein [Flavobacterium psychrophilum]EKT4537465.1 hypothetical protein [Flavobacterium psychrophilum]
MKKLHFTCIIIMMIVSFSSLQAQVGVGTTAPFGALDITSTNDGILIPRLSLSATNVATILTPTVSELVYNNFTSAVGPNQVTPGFYYWDGALWVRVATGVTSSDWTILGNSGTVATTNFVGTTDAIDFVTRTNNTEKTRVTSAGNMGIGTAIPATKLDVAAATTTVNTVVNASGSINDYLQYNIQNTSTGIQAQSGYSATADNGSSTTGFAWLGINNSTFNFPTPYNIGNANDVSFVGSGQDMHIANANNTKSIIFSTGKAVSPFFNERMRITNTGAVGIGTTTPNGALDINAGASNYGFVAPRVALTASNTQVPVTNPQGGAILAGTTIYNTATAGVSPNNVGPGLYYWNGTKWVTFAGSPGGLDWTLTGNAGTTAGTNFIGTTDAVDFVTRTNNTEKMRVGSNGSVTINTGAAPSAFEKLQVNHTGASNDAILAINNDDAIGKGNAIWAKNTNATGTAIIGSSGATPPSLFPNIGAGISGSHVDGYGVYGSCGNGAPSNAAYNGHAAANFVLDSDNNSATNNFSAVAKLAGKDNVSPDGILSSQNVLYGGYFQGGITTSSYSYAGIKYNHDAAGGAGTNYKIIGNGAASTIIPDKNSKPRVMFCPEAPEVLFEDYGIGKLNDGEVYIILDEILANSLKVDNKHPLKVFIQLEGDSNGVFVSEKSINGFKVKEVNNGKSNISFSWHIVGNRADSKDASGNITSEFENLRLPIGPTKLKEDKLVTKKTEK